AGRRRRRGRGRHRGVLVPIGAAGHLDLVAHVPLEILAAFELPRGGRAAGCAGRRRGRRGFGRRRADAAAAGRAGRPGGRGGRIRRARGGRRGAAAGAIVHARVRQRERAVAAARETTGHRHFAALVAAHRVLIL